VRAARRPTAAAVVALPEGPSMTAVVVDSDVHAMRIGDPVVLCFLQAEGGQQVPAFTTVAAEQARQYAQRALAAAREVPGLPDLPAGFAWRGAAVVGAGNMGSGITTALIAAGLRVCLIDREEAALQRARDTVAGNLESLAKRGWLPWSHVAGGSINFGTVLHGGGTMWLDDGKPAPGQFDETLRNLREISPTEFGSVPIGYSMLVDALEQDEALAQSLFRQLRFATYAGAKMPEDVYERWQAVAVRTIGQRIPFISAFGSTETSASVTIAHWCTEFAGNIGLPHPGVTVKLTPLDDDRYEIAVQSDVITPGYLHRPDATAEVFDDEGFFLMGDAVQFVDPDDPAQGLVFAGRVAEEFKLQSGVFVRVGALRSEVINAAHGLLSDVVVAGADQAYVALLAWPNMPVCRARSGMAEASVAEMVASDWMRAAVAEVMQRHNGHGGASSRQIRRVLLLEEMPSMGDGEITDKGYVNQRRVLTRRAQDVARLYAPTPDAQVIVIT